MVAQKADDLFNQQVSIGKHGLYTGRGYVRNMKSGADRNCSLQRRGNVLGHAARDNVIPVPRETELQHG
jgi:hypothetical protein